MLNLKWPPKEAEAISKAIQERFKARTPKGKQDHFLKCTNVITGNVELYKFSSKPKRAAAKKALAASENPPQMELVSKPKLEEGEYIKS